MAIKPVDFQILVPRTMDAAKISNDETHRNQALLQQQAAVTQQKAADSLKTVYSRAQAQEARIQEKQKDDRQENKKKKKDGRNTGKNVYNSKNRLNDAVNTSTIDIKI